MWNMATYGRSIALYRHIYRYVTRRNLGLYVIYEWLETNAWLTGAWLTGAWLTGDQLTGDWLTGDWMTDDRLTGDWMTGERLTGDKLPGDWMTGDRLTWLVDRWLVGLMPGQTLSRPGCHLDGSCPEQYSYEGRCSHQLSRCQTGTFWFSLISSVFFSASLLTF